MNSSPLTQESDRLIDYFLLVGATDEALAEAAAADDAAGPPPECVPRLLDRYPRRDHAGAGRGLQPGLVLMAFPNGLQLQRAPSASHCPLPSFFVFVTTDIASDKAFGHCLVIWELVPAPAPAPAAAARASVPPIPHTLFAPRVLCLFSRWNFGIFRRFLAELYRLSISPGLRVPLERHIQNIVSEIPLPPAGRVQVACAVGGLSRVLLRRAPRNRRVAATNLGAPLRALFECLDVGRALLVWRCLLAERPVLFVSSQLSLLTAVAEALVALLYPLKWCHPFIPILPAACIDMLQMPMAHLCGVSADLFARLDAAGDQVPPQTVVVQLDENRVSLAGGEASVSGSRAGEDALPAPPPMPSRELAALAHALRRYARPAFVARPAAWRTQVLPHFDDAFAFARRPHEAEGAPDADDESSEGSVSSDEDNDDDDDDDDDDYGGEAAEDDETGHRVHGAEHPQSRRFRPGRVRRAFFNVFTSLLGHVRDFIVVKPQPVAPASLGASPFAAAAAAAAGASTPKLSASASFTSTVTSASAPSPVASASPREGFDADAFLRSAYVATDARAFAAGVIESQMFSQFVDARLHLADCDADTLFFDESVDALHNRRPAALNFGALGGRRATPFLSSRAEIAGSKTVEALPPDETGLPAGASFSLDHFPRALDERLFSPHARLIPKFADDPHLLAGLRQRQQARPATRPPLQLQPWRWRGYGFGLSGGLGLGGQQSKEAVQTLTRGPAPFLESPQAPSQPPTPTSTPLAAIGLVLQRASAFAASHVGAAAIPASPSAPTSAASPSSFFSRGFPPPADAGFSSSPAPAPASLKPPHTLLSPAAVYAAARREATYACWWLVFAAHLEEAEELLLLGGAGDAGSGAGDGSTARTDFSQQSLALAVDVLARMRHEGAAPPELAFRTCLRCCGRAGDFGRGFVLLEDMARSGFAPDTLLINAVFAAYVNAPSQQHRPLSLGRRQLEQQQHAERLCLQRKDLEQRSALPTPPKPPHAAPTAPAPAPPSSMLSPAALHFGAFLDAIANVRASLGDSSAAVRAGSVRAAASAAESAATSADRVRKNAAVYGPSAAIQLQLQRGRPPAAPRRASAPDIAAAGPLPALQLPLPPAGSSARIDRPRGPSLTGRAAALLLPGGGALAHAGSRQAQPRPGSIAALSSRSPSPVLGADPPVSPASLSANASALASALALAPALPVAAREAAPRGTQAASMPVRAPSLSGRLRGLGSLAKMYAAGVAATSGSLVGAPGEWQRAGDLCIEGSDREEADAEAAVDADSEAEAATASIGASDGGSDGGREDDNGDEGDEFAIVSAVGESGRDSPFPRAGSRAFSGPGFAYLAPGPWAGQGLPAIVVNGTTVCPAGHALSANDVTRGFDPFDEDVFTACCPLCSGGAGAARRFVARFSVGGNAVMWLPPLALRKELLLGLGLAGSSIATAAALVTAPAARQLALRLRDGGRAGGNAGSEETTGEGASPLFWNLVVLFERARLPGDFLLWSLLGAGVRDAPERAAASRGAEAAATTAAPAP